MDAKKALKACLETVTQPGRQIAQYMKYRYFPADTKDSHWSVSKTVEYAYNDWCIAQMAKAMGETEHYKTFSKRADNWKNLYDSASTFLRPKNVKGQFTSPFVAKEYTEPYCESNAWQYFWFVPHNIEGLIDTLGQSRFIAKLDSMFTYYPEPDDKLPMFSTGMIGQYAHGNEPSHHVSFLYNYVGEHWKTQEMVRRILTTQYSTLPDGYCGNEDCGQMSAWLVFTSMGIYPVNPANGIYDITSPLLKEATIHLENGKQFIFSTENQSEKNPYIQAISLNGNPYNQLTITHQQIMEGGDLHFILGPTPNKELIK
jgi:predicted alpha-1,2-mannosidase